MVVAWDLDTTGRRLIDEICHIGAHYVNSEGEDLNFSQYVMPYKNPNPGARRSFGIRFYFLSLSKCFLIVNFCDLIPTRVVNIGRYRMLKDMESGKILKTKSEVSALQEFIDWLRESAEREGAPKNEGVLLACHEPTRKVLVPLLLEALDKYNLGWNYPELHDKKLAKSTCMLRMNLIFTVLFLFSRILQEQRAKSGLKF